MGDQGAQWFCFRKIANMAGEREGQPCYCRTLVNNYLNKLSYDITAPLIKNFKNIPLVSSIESNTQIRELVPSGT